MLLRFLWPAGDSLGLHRNTLRVFWPPAQSFGLPYHKVMCFCASFGRPAIHLASTGKHYESFGRRLSHLASHSIRLCAFAILLAFSLENLASHSIRLCAFARPLAGQPFIWPPIDIMLCLEVNAVMTWLIW